MDKRRWIALSLFIVGWLIGLPIYFLSAPDAADPLADYEGSKKYQADVERIGGKGALIGSQISDFISGLFHGATLGLTLGVIMTLVALIYYVNAEQP